MHGRKNVHVVGIFEEVYNKNARNGKLKKVYSLTSSL